MHSTPVKKITHLVKNMPAAEDTLERLEQEPNFVFGYITAKKNQYKVTTLHQTYSTVKRQHRAYVNEDVIS